MYKVFLSENISDDAYQRLAGNVEIVKDFDHPEELDAIIVRQEYCTRDIISRARKCRIIQQHGTGLDRIDVKAAEEFGIPVFNTPGMNAQSVAEYAIMLMLCLSRKALSVDRKVRAGELPLFGMPETVGIEMFGKRLGIVGSGHVARAVASIAKNGFGMKVSCYSEHCSREHLCEIGFEPASSIHELFAVCDYVSLHNLLTSKNYHMINADVLSSAKPGLIFINTARGSLVDETALYKALIQGKIGGAGLDVLEKQPPDVSNPLLSLDNVVVGMHVGGSTYDAMQRNGKAVVDNVFRVLGISEI